MVKAVKALVGKLTSSILTGLALAAGEEPAVVRALDLLAKELWTLLSCTSLSLLTNPTRGRGDNLPRVLSPFPQQRRGTPERSACKAVAQSWMYVAKWRYRVQPNYFHFSMG